MTINAEDKAELFSLLDEWQAGNDSKKAEAEAKRKATEGDGPKNDNGDDSGSERLSFAERLLGRSTGDAKRK